MSNLLFDRLIDRAKGLGLSIQNAANGRFIRRVDDGDAEMMAHADVFSLVVTRQIKLLRIVWNETLYFCVSGLPEPEELPSGLESVDLTPGTFTLTILFAHILPSATVTPAEIRDAIEADYCEEHNGYQGHDLSIICRMFPRIHVYKALDLQDYHDSNHRVLGSMLAKTYFDGPIQLTPAAIERMSNLFEGGPRFIPYKNLVQGILAISWENLFLEIYRCIEQLYAAPRVRALRNDWQSALSGRKLARLLEQHLAWRPKEDEALFQVIKDCDDTMISSACLALGVVDLGETPAGRGKVAARLIYELRNHIVHYRPTHEPIEKSDDEWDRIICVLLLVLQQSYENHGGDFFDDDDTEKRS